MPAITITTDDAVLDGIEAATEAAYQADLRTTAVQAVLRSEASDQRAADDLAFAAVAVTAALQGGVSARQLAGDLKVAGAKANSKDSVGVYAIWGAVLALPVDPDSDHADDSLAAVAARFATNGAVRKGVSRPAIRKAVDGAGDRDEAIRRVAALKPEAKPEPEATPEPEVTPEPQGDEGEGEGTPDKGGRTPWQERLATLVAQSLVEGATPDEVRAVVAAVLS